jgi:O-antigen biosynthesis protein
MNRAMKRLKDKVPSPGSLMRFVYRQIPLEFTTKRAVVNALLFSCGCLVTLWHNITRPIVLACYQIIGYPNRPRQTRRKTMRDLEKVSFPACTIEPKISIVIPCYNHFSYVVACLRSIAEDLPALNIEVIVIDDASSEDLSPLGTVKGIKYVRNEENLGYIKSCNKGAELAAGEYLYLLNNDTRVLSNSIEALYYTFKRLPNTGLAGSKLIYPDYRLQEAGGIVWRDGSAWNYGRFKPASKPSYNYLRPVDYCSAASVLIPRKLFLEIGGFDEAFLPAYYEDTDLAFRIRAKGHDVVYQPESVVIHYEGTTNGLARHASIKSYQYLNQQEFAGRWIDRLRLHNEPGQHPDEEKDRYLTKRVLLIDNLTPTPDQDAGSAVLLNLMILLRGLGYQPTFIPSLNFTRRTHYTRLCQSLGIECLYSPYLFSIRSHLSQFGSRYDLVILLRPANAQNYISMARRLCPKAKIFYYPHDLHYLRLERQYRQNGNSKALAQSLKSKKVELNNSKQADLTIVLSHEEHRLLSRELPGCNIDVIPLILSDPKSSGRASPPGNHNIMFIGGFNHAPNEDGVLWFANTILPKIVQVVPTAHFYVIGPNPPRNVRALQSNSISICGYVANLEDFLPSMRVSVVPLRFGAGLKGKIGTALRSGVPVVSTAIGVEGMTIRSGEDLVQASSTTEFANSVIDILTNNDIWMKLHHGGLNFAQSQWGKETSFNSLKSILLRNCLAVDPQCSPEKFELYPFH